MREGEDLDKRIAETNVEDTYVCLVDTQSKLTTLGRQDDKPPSQVFRPLGVTQVDSERYSLRDRKTTLPTRISTNAEIGRGGIGRVLVAFDHHLGRQVAVKEILPARLPKTDHNANEPILRCEPLPRAVVRFLREARITGQLEHPNIVPIYELGIKEDQTLYYTMKLVRGRTLAQALQEARDLRQRLSLLGHFVDICQAIGYAHSRGVVHRDLKPENIMLGEFGETVVLDWGLAKLHNREEQTSATDPEMQIRRELSQTQTLDGTTLGTPAYMSPEQAEGQLERIDERSDVWSLGVVLYEILTGVQPFQGSSAVQVIGQVLHAPYRPIQEVCAKIPPELASVCEKALQREQASRYQHAKDLADDVNAYLTFGRVKAYRYGLGDLVRLYFGQYRIAFIVGVIGCVLLLVLGAWSWIRLVEDRDRAQELQRQADSARQTARFRLAEAHCEGARSAWIQGDMLEARAKLRSALEVRDSVVSRVLWDQVQDEPLVFLKKLGSLVYDVAISPANGVIAAAGHDGTIYLLDPQTAQLKTLRGHKPWVATLSFSPDGGLLASAGSSGSIRIWRMDQLQLVSEFRAHLAAIHDVVFNRQGTQIASAGQDHTVRIFDVHNHKNIQTLSVGSDFVWCLGFSPDGRWLLSGSWKGFLRLFDVSTGHRVWRIDTQLGGVAALALNPAGKLLATGSTQGQIGLWQLDWNRPQATPLGSLLGHTDGIAELDFAPDGNTLASGSYDNTVGLWNSAKRAKIATIAKHTNWVGGVSFSPDGRYLATGSEDRSVALWRLPYRSSQHLPNRGHQDQVNSLAYSPDGRFIATGADDHSVRIWHAQTGVELMVLPGHSDSVNSTFFSAPNRLVSAGRDRRLYYWRLDLDACLQGRCQVGQPQIQLLGGKGDLVSHVELSSDGRWAAASAYDHSIHLFNTQTGGQRSLVGHTDLVRHVVFSPNGQQLASASWDKTIRIWSSHSGLCQRVLRGHQRQVDNVAFAPDGQSVFSSSWDQTLRQFDLKSGTNRIITTFQGRLTNLRLQADGKVIVASAEDGQIYMWDLQTAALQKFQAHSKGLNDIGLSPCGRYVASVGDDGTVRQWHIESHLPRWRASAMIRRDHNPPLVYTQQGFSVVGQTSKTDPGSIPWKDVLRQSRLSSISSDGSLLCSLNGASMLEMRRVSDSGPVRFHSIPRADRLVAFADACWVLSHQTVYRFDAPKTEPQTIATDALALATTDELVLIGRAAAVGMFDISGTLLRSLPADVGISAVAGVHLATSDQVIVGYEDGTVERISLEADSIRQNLSLEQVPSSAVHTILGGPNDTVILGYANGLVGLWDLNSGNQLAQAHLHGPLAQSYFYQGKLYLTTELGDQFAWDLSVFHLEYCELMKRVWSTVPIVWQRGRPTSSQPPVDHVCAAPAR